MDRPRPKGCGFFRRRGALVEGRIRGLWAVWNRHMGGIPIVLDVGETGRSVRMASRVRVTQAGRSILLKQEYDPDPRIIICEQGPQRIALRVMYSLLDETGTYHGDGLTETMLWADGEVRSAFALRLVDAAAHDAINDAWIEMQTTGTPRAVVVGTRRRRRLTPTQLRSRPSYRFKGDLPGRLVAIQTQGVTAFGWYSPDARATDDLAGVGLWHGPGDRAPYYDTWGHLYSQWEGLAGWGAHPSGQLVVAQTDQGIRADWHWLHHASRSCGANFGVKAMTSLYLTQDMPDAMRRIEALQNPIRPRVEGGQFRCLDAVENTLLCKKTDSTFSLTFPRDRLKRTAHVRVFGIPRRAALELRIQDELWEPHLVSLGGMTDDPYGPNLARPGDRFVPIIGDPMKGPFEAVFSVPLSARQATTVTLQDRPGVDMAYVKWDDHQRYVIRSSNLHTNPLATFSTQTLCLHDLRGAAGEQPALVRVPLYWYPTNVQTRGHCLNELQHLRLSANGPESVCFRVLSRNPNGRARSSVLIEIPAARSQPIVRASARFDVLKRWDLDQIQYLNSFPSGSWQPGHWPDSWVVVMTADGRVMQQFFKEPRLKQRMGSRIQTWRNKLFFAQGSADRGNIFILVENGKPARQPHGYMLCPVWLDSHFSIEDLKAPVRAGRSFEVSYTIGIGSDSGLARSEAIEIGRRSLAAGKLDLS